MEDNWKWIKWALSSTCQEVLGRDKHHHHKEWIPVETPDKVQERKNKKIVITNSQTRTEKVKAQAEYTEANKKTSGKSDGHDNILSGAQKSDIEATA